MKIKVFTLCKNEILIAPFFVDYWKSLADEVEVFVYDGFSTDGTFEYLSQYNWINVIQTKENSELDDFFSIQLKNNIWKKHRGTCDFVMVCDFDETIMSYSVEELHSTLDKMKTEGYSILLPLSFNVVSDDFPKYETNKFLHEICVYGFNDFIMETKAILFDPNKITEINYIPGSHACFPKGEVKWFNTQNLFLIHAKYLGFDYYFNRIHNRELSENNKKCGLWAEKDKIKNNMLAEFNEMKNKRFKWTEIKNNFMDCYNVYSDWSPWGYKKLTYS